MGKNWIRRAKPKKGALHRQLGYSMNDTLPLGLLKGIANTNIGAKYRGYRVTPKLKRRVNFALNVRKWRA